MRSPRAKGDEARSLLLKSSLSKAAAKAAVRKWRSFFCVYAAPSFRRTDFLGGGVGALSVLTSEKWGHHKVQNADAPGCERPRRVTLGRA